MRLPWSARRLLGAWAPLANEMESVRRDLLGLETGTGELHVFLACPDACGDCRLPPGMLRQLIEDCIPGGVARARAPLWSWAGARRLRRRGALVLDITCRTFARTTAPASAPFDGGRALQRRVSRHFGRGAAVTARLHSPGCSIYSITVPQ
jgi:hypothetical protein